MRVFDILMLREYEERLNGIFKTWFKYVEKRDMRGAGASPLSYVPVTNMAFLELLIKRIAKKGDKSKRF